MTCSATRAKPRAHSLDLRKPLQIEVMGTWDFKWPLGKRIRVAFQQPRMPNVASRTLEAAIAQVKTLAETWTASAGASVAFDWGASGPLVLPPAAGGQRQNRSAFRLPARESFAGFDYDVLVSFDALPLEHWDPIAPQRLLDRIFLPKSELGSYARRLDYGVPSVFIGPLPGLWQSGQALDDYYASNRLARFYVVHEFGHVLGLAHEHQSPRRRARDATLRSLPAELDAVCQRLGSVLSERIPARFDAAELAEFVQRNITEPWPGNEQYSDWRDDLGNSVLFVPYLGCLTGAHAVTPGAECAECEALLVDRPTDSDLAQLRRMYPARRAAAARVRLQQ